MRNRFNFPVCPVEKGPTSSAIGAGGAPHVVWRVGTTERWTESIRIFRKINTAFIERLNLTLRQGVSFLTRRTWGMAQYTPELEISLDWWRGYYHFVRYHESLSVKLTQPLVRKGKQTPRKYRRRTPAAAAGLTNHRWTVIEFLSYPLP